MRDLILYRQPKKFLEKLINKDSSLTKKIILALEELKINSLPNSSKQLIGYKELYRIRVEKHRIVYQFDKLSIRILLIETRDKIYSEIRKL